MMIGTEPKGWVKPTVRLKKNGVLEEERWKVGSSI